MRGLSSTLGLTASGSFGTPASGIPTRTLWPRHSVPRTVSRTWDKRSQLCAADA
ncbi:hypothetical protein PF006_g27660 [Phytophthora fragariae]|uniref:Uncharacterized protein n=1 Tax=Phytophthora fragariae TaxID=53985 RepID=A0A6A3QL19_9STRA|nr:hypothetical protein PF006_g27660 [Phytophthora fragariae]